jgi:phosphoglycolate phosphatase
VSGSDRTGHAGGSVARRICHRPATLLREPPNRHSAIGARIVTAPSPNLQGRPLTGLLVDLDGTLTDPVDGITRSLRHAMAALGRPVPDDTDLSWSIGPPLMENIRRLMPDADDATLWAGIAAYRERYGSVGKLENAVYPGIPEALDRLRAAGLTLHLATSKLELHARDILDHFGLASHFTTVHGSKPDGSHAVKAELIAHILGADGLDPAGLAMVGDRKHDVIGAARHGIPTIGVAWGYGGHAELSEAGAAVIVEDPTGWVAAILGPAY